MSGRRLIFLTLCTATMWSATAAAAIGHTSASAGRDAASVLSFAPTEGAEGVAVEISGSGFTGATDVQFGGLSAVYSVDSDTQITANVPVGATTAPISVVTPDGTVTSTGSFTYIPIQHIVIVDEENHSFNDMLGKFCVDHAAGTIVRDGVNDPCKGTDVGVLSNGSTIPLTGEPDGGLKVFHGVIDQSKAMHGGLMNGFDKVRNCTATSKPAYACFSQYDPIGGPCGAQGGQTCIPNVVQWAKSFAIADMTFEFRQTPSWAGHMVLADATIEKFQGGIPTKKGVTLPKYPGWGCDSGLLTTWVASGKNTLVPPCVPDQSGSMGPLWDGTSYASAPHAQYVPTIMDRLIAAGRSWKIYGGQGPLINGNKKAGGYGWTICPTFWECLGSSQINDFVPGARFATDAAAGNLPEVSYVTPFGGGSMHQPAAASVGDNWLQKYVVGPAMNGPEWSSTAIFVTWDDCGCFYDAVSPPNPLWGVRVPMEIISPFAKPGYTDSTPATFVSMLAFVEHVFNLPPLNPCSTVDQAVVDCTDDLVGNDGQPMYDYMNSFDWNQTPLPPTPAHHTAMNAADRAHQKEWAEEAGDEDT